MSESPLKFERHGAVARLTLNRPDAGNAIDMALATALKEAAIACDEDAAIRCVLLTGAGRLFCAGGDIGGFLAAGENIGPYLTELTAVLHSAVSRLARMGKPLVTAINGPAAGAGLSLAVLGDIALASTRANFTVAYSAIGLTPDGGASWFLPRLIGLRRARELILTNKRVSAEEAVQLGLVTSLVAEAELDAEAEKTAERLAASAIGALGQARALLLASYGNDLEAQMALEARTIATAAGQAEAREGISAFLEKRKPAFG